MCENNMKNMHTDVRINDYFSSENITFTLYKKSYSKQIIFLVKLIHIITFCFIALFDVKLDRLSTLKRCFNKIMVNISKDISLLLMALNVTLRKKEKKTWKWFYYFIHSKNGKTLRAKFPHITLAGEQLLCLDYFKTSKTLYLSWLLC